MSADILLDVPSWVKPVVYFLSKIIFCLSHANDQHLLQYLLIWHICKHVLQKYSIIWCDWVNNSITQACMHSLTRTRAHTHTHTRTHTHIQIYRITMLWHTVNFCYICNNYTYIHLKYHYEYVQVYRKDNMWIFILLGAN